MMVRTDMRFRSLRKGISLLLVFTLVGMMPLRVSMAMPMSAQGTTHHGPASNGQMPTMGSAASQQAAFHDGLHGQSNQCHCAHCALCGVCHSAMAASMAGIYVSSHLVPAELRLSTLTDTWFPPDPRPPRA